MKNKITPIFSLWILISLALLLYLAISFTEDFHIGPYTPEKASFKEKLTERKITDQPLYRKISSVDTIPPQDSIIVIKPDTTIRSVLIFGDSMTHHLGMSIAKYGTKNNYYVTSVTWESSSILGWASSDKLSHYLEMSRPDFVFISLGSNEMGLKNFDARIPQVKKIIEKIGDRPYIWVGPPLWKEDKGLYPMIQSNIANGHFFSTGNLDLERGPDHIHPTKRGADQWADTLMRWQLNSFHPIPADLPDSGTNNKGHKFIYLHPDD